MEIVRGGPKFYTDTHTHRERERETHTQTHTHTPDAHFMSFFFKKETRLKM